MTGQGGAGTAFRNDEAVSNGGMVLCRADPGANDLGFGAARTARRPPL
jgi:hypothetical protein